MEWLVILGLGMIVVRLWRRVDRLERQLQGLEPEERAAPPLIEAKRAEPFTQPETEREPAPPPPVPDLPSLVPSWEPAEPIPLEAEDPAARDDFLGERGHPGDDATGL